MARVAEAPHHLFQRPDAARLHEHPYGTTLRGVSAETRLSRVGGALRWDLTARAVSPGFDVNETGFQRNSDWILVAGAWRYERFRPGRWIRSWTVGSENLGLGWSWAGEPRARTLSAFGSMELRSYWTARLSATHELPALSMERLRGGPALLLPPLDALAFSLITDSRNPTYASLDVTASREPGSNSSAFSLSPLANVRPSDRVQWSIGPTWQADTVGWQYLTRRGEGADAEYVVSRVRQRTLALTLRADILFSPRMALQLYAQPFATVGRYDGFQRLVAPRAPEPGLRFVPLSPEQATALPRPDAQQRALNASVVLRWEYRPGSYLTAVWNHRRDATEEGVTSPGRALRSLFADPATNVLLLKASLRLGS